MRRVSQTDTGLASPPIRIIFNPVPLRYLTIDFNSFFASVEQEERPELRGKPVGIVPVMAETTGCIAVSLEAKAAGLTRNARVADARRICPGLVVVEARPELYITYHRRLVQVIAAHVAETEVQSIDEVTARLHGFLSRPQAEKLAKQIKADLAREIGPRLRSSIGIAPTWLMAKVASDMQKPDGLVILEDADIPEKILHLKPGDIAGIGPNIQRRLEEHGITTMAQLFAANAHVLRGVWGGVRGEQMWRLLHGEDLSYFEHEGGKTIGHGHVLPPAKRNATDALAVLHRLLQKAAMRLRHSQLFASALSISVDYLDETRWSDELRLSETQDTLRLTHALNELWAKRPAQSARLKPLRVGLHLTGLIDLKLHTPDLFEGQTEKARGKLFAAVDHLNKVLGKNTVYLGGAHGATKDAPMRIAFTRIPEPEIEEIDRSFEGRLKKRKPPPKEPEVW
ncbi:DNA polymerase [Oleiharenicola lentus]|jgi:DNA polymerase-4|uniref:DNA polymerase n=1 Tax=Oleiharenicola lentus TaxID=2508720 RepID=A0A4Q1CCI5_9BACT|nr:DNA polymerase [Oleiharenicola lentus]RXK56845.1 DNA polymerase [Oleiharenicola lentus]